jgi:tripartite-type tricarboxylate transporter receptor subunit TctC
MRTLLRSIVAAALLAAGAAHAADAPVTIVVPFPPGGPTDTVGRILAKSMSISSGKNIIIENAGGAGGTVGSAKVARANPDGKTFLLHHIGHAVAPTLYKNLPYQPLDAFDHVGLIIDVPMTFVARPGFPAKNMNELVTYVKANKDKVAMGNSGVGSASHLCGMLFMETIGVNLTTIPYKGTGPAMNDLMGGTIDVMCDQSTNTTSQIRANKIQVYGVTVPKRMAALPNVPTVKESGINLEVSVWHGLYAPKGTPEPILAEMNEALKVALKDPEVLDRFAGLGAEPVAEDRVTPEAHRAHVKAEIEKWAPVIQRANAYAD